MSNVIKCTTPTFKYTFSVVPVNTITEAYLTIEQAGAVKLERDLTTATVGDKYLTWTLTQAETLSFASGTASVMLNWLTSGGTRGASGERTVIFARNLKPEVI